MTQWKKKNKKQEGFSVKEGMTIDDDIDAARAKIADEITPTASTEDAGPSMPSISMGEEFKSILDGIETLTKGNVFYDSLDSAISIGSDTKSLYGEMNLSYLNFKGFSTSIATMMQQIGSLISYFFQVFFSYLILIKMSIELFVLNFNTYLSTVLTKIANALTQNTASATEITTFKDQTQKFLMLLMVWIFVYNWYYVCFYVKDQDNIRYSFNADHVKTYSMLLYGMFGPACRTIEHFNSIIMGSAKVIQKYIGNNFIYVGMFFLFMMLVAFNFQSILIIDFFNALHHQYGTSTISIFTMACVAYYAFSYVKNDSIIPSLFWWAFPFGIVLFLIALVFYAIWTVAVNIPLGILFIFTYLFVYSFMGVLFYEGSNIFNTFTGISENISNIHPDVTQNDICITPPGFQFSKIPQYIWFYTKKAANWMTAYMFEIFSILILLGGIGVYSANFTSSIAGKSGASTFSTSSVKAAFKFLFTWLIIINIIIIALLITFMVQKYKYIQSEIPPANAMLPSVNIIVPGPQEGAFGGNNFLAPPS